MNKKHLIFGAIFGLIAPALGLFAGLQVAPFLGTILMFPFIIVGAVTGDPFGEFSTAMKIISVILSIGLWALIFGFIGNFLGKSKS